MIEDFFVRALLGGVGVALIAGPLGCLVVWRRMAYFGATLSHSALLGVALGFLAGVQPTLGIVATCLAVALALGVLDRSRTLATDTVLGVLAHVALAAGLVVVAFLEELRVDLLGYLFGDVLSVGPGDLLLIWGGALAGLACLALLWRPLLSMTVNEDLAAVEGVNVAGARIAFMLLLAAVVAIGMKVIGMLLVVSLLVVPAAAARRLARSPESMAAAATAIGAGAVILGLLGSLRFDLPSGPMIVLAAAALFAGGLLLPARSG